MKFLLYIFGAGMEQLYACAFFLKNVLVMCFNSSEQQCKKQNIKNITQKLFSLKTVYLWSIFSLNMIYTPFSDLSNIGF